MWHGFVIAAVVVVVALLVLAVLQAAELRGVFPALFRKVRRHGRRGRR